MKLDKIIVYYVKENVNIINFLLTHSIKNIKIINFFMFILLTTAD